MVQAEFFESNGVLKGFRFSGHAGYAEAGADVACAAVSSAVQLIVNILDEFGFEPDVKADGGAVECAVKNTGDKPSRLLNVLRQHFESILEEFPGTINIIISEV